MDNIVDLIASGASAAQISDEIKDALYGKSAEKIDALRPLAAASLFGGGEQPEVVNELEVESEEDEDEETKTEDQD
tara:strand:+ start:6656 stop:6883 length:228 start_codon:yes stop_codon:yes gene_type:complete